MGRVVGKVALVTGAARGQGRSHAVRLAEEGADIIAVDVCQNTTPMFAGATEEDLAETVRLVEKHGRRIIARKADVRDFTALKAAVDEGVAELGRLDTIVANAGTISYCNSLELAEEEWDAIVDVCMKGVWLTLKAGVPHIIAGGRGGSIIMTSSTAGHKGLQHMAHYAAAKHGVEGLMKVFALELAQHSIRVNCVRPTAVNTDMVLNQPMYDVFRPDIADPTVDDCKEALAQLHLLPIPWINAIDISNAVLYLASDEARYVTGSSMSVDAGMQAK
jgi:SDR family mycofactocin-dependent oxidoreductase